MLLIITKSLSVPVQFAGDTKFGGGAFESVIPSSKGDRVMSLDRFA